MRPMPASPWWRSAVAGRNRERRQAGHAQPPPGRPAGSGAGALPMAGGAGRPGRDHRAVPEACGPARRARAACAATPTGRCSRTWSKVPPSTGTSSSDRVGFAGAGLDLGAHRSSGAGDPARRRLRTRASRRRAVARRHQRICRDRPRVLRQGRAELHQLRSRPRGASGAAGRTRSRPSWRGLPADR